MLKWMRDSSQSFLIYVLFGMLVLVFAINFGPGSGSCGGVALDYAAKVNGEVIRKTEFGLTYQSRLEYMRRSGAFGGNMNDDRLQQQLRRQVIDALVDQRLLVQQGRRLGLTVSDQDLLDHLKKTYGVDQVDYADYENWVSRQFETTVTKFEDRVRGDIIAERLGTMIKDNIDVGEKELEQTYLRDHNRAMVELVRFDAGNADIPEPTKAQIDDLLAKDHDAVQARYDKEIFKYRTPKEVKARQILKKLAPDASDADVAKAKAALMDLKSQIEGGADFGALAKSESEDEATKDKGGDLGFVKMGEMARPIVDKLFAMKTDELTDEPVRSPQGLHLMQVTEIHPPARKKLEEVERDVAKDILMDRAREAIAKKKADTLLKELQGGADLASLTWTHDEDKAARDAAKESGKPVANAKPVRTTSAWILASSETVAGVGKNKEMHDAIFNLTADKPLLDQPFQQGQYWYVAKLKERETPDMSKFAAEKDSLHESAVWTKRVRVYQDWLDYLRKHSKVELNPELFPADLPNAGA